MLRSLLFVLLATTVAGAQSYSTAAGISAQEAAAARRVMMHALQSGHQGGCASLPAGWSSVRAVVRFPASYGGYGSWVNDAELLPVGANLQQFLNGHSGGRFIQPAVGNDRSVSSTLCAPAGFSYWLIVDSGTAKTAIGRVTILRPGRAYRVVMTAPPLRQ